MKKYVLILFLFCSVLYTACGNFQDVTFSGIESVKIVTLSQQGAEAEVIAKIKNPNNVSFNVYSTDLNVMLAGIDAGEAHLSEHVKIKANSEQSYTFKIKSDFSKLNLMELPKLLSLAMSKNVKVGLKGNLKVGKWYIKRTIPVDVQHTVPLDKF
jgi:LEA14-like dessication related protein